MSEADKDSNQAHLNGEEIQLLRLISEELKISAQLNEALKSEIDDLRYQVKNLRSDLDSANKIIHDLSENTSQLMLGKRGFLNALRSSVR